MQRALRLIGCDLASFTALSGGSLSSVVRLHCASGSTAVAKFGAACAVEADMLRAIHATGAPAPKVLAVEQDLLVLEDLGDDMGLTGVWPQLALALRTLHASNGPYYGWPMDYSFGPVEIPNCTKSDWPVFWAERRLLAGTAGVPTEITRRVDKLCHALPDRLPRTPQPALLHGDLWGGNIVANGTNLRGLIDPACYYGHAEVDLAMLCLFDNPDDSFWGAYGPTAPNLDDRRAIYQLWPALVHLRLFGNSYRSLVEKLLSQCAS